MQREECVTKKSLQYLQASEDQWHLPGEHSLLLADYKQDGVLEVLRAAVHVHPHCIHLWETEHKLKVENKAAPNLGGKSLCPFLSLT